MFSKSEYGKCTHDILRDREQRVIFYDLLFHCRKTALGVEKTS